MKTSRRALLTAALGATQVGLLEKLGLNPLRPGTARAAGAAPRPTKLVTIMVVGGWQPMLFFSPLKLDQVATYMPAPSMSSVPNVMQYHSRAHVEKNLDGTPAVDPGSAVASRKVRVPRVWNDAQLAAGMAPQAMVDPITGMATVPHGYIWATPQYSLWENLYVVHGVDQGSVAHLSGRIGSLCGYAAPDWKDAGCHAVVGNAMYQRFPDRVLPAVTVNGLGSNRRTLPALADPVQFSSIGALQQTLSESSTSAWSGLTTGAGGRSPKPQLTFSGADAGLASTHPIDDFVLAETRRLKGRTNEVTDGFFEQIHDAYLTASSTIAKDVVSTLQATVGFEHTTPPFWSPGRMMLRMGGSVYGAGQTEANQLDLVLRLLKSDVTSAVSARIAAPIPTGGGYFDTHGGEGFNHAWMFAVMEQIGQFIAEMKSTPAPSGVGTLLDETLVMIVSDFGRTWPKSGASDHNLYHSAVYIGGSYLQGNQMVGAYDVTSKPADSAVFEGMPLTMKSENGTDLTRPPRAHDVMYSAYKLMGIDRFMSDGPGEFPGMYRT